MTTHLTLAEAQRLIELALAESLRRGVKTAAAAVDARGDLIAAARLDGARHYYPDVAYGKAIAAALWEQPSRALAQRSAANSVQQRVNGLNGGRLVFAPGAIPLRRDGQTIGALGVGGSGGDSDEEIALIAARGLEFEV